MGVGIPELHLPEFMNLQLVDLIPGAITLAMLGSIDSLLSAQMADSLTHEKHEPNRELVSQGLGNIAAGFIGGVPGGPTTVSMVANIRSGGRTQIAGLMCAATVLVVTLFLEDLVESIPYAVLAAILLNLGWSVIDWRFLYLAGRGQREHFVVMMTTLGLTLFMDVVTALVIGLMAAAMVHVRQFERLELDSIVSLPLLDDTFLGADLNEDRFDDFSSHVGLVAFRGSRTVASSNRIVQTIGNDIKDHAVVIFDFSDTVHIDDSATMVIERLLMAAAIRDTDCIIMGLHGQPRHSLTALDVLRLVPEELVVEDLEEARQGALRLLGR